MEHKQKLLEQGWTLPELFARKITPNIHKPGIAWMGYIWYDVKKGRAKVEIKSDHILFTGKKAVRGEKAHYWTQRAWPDKNNPAYRR